MQGAVVVDRKLPEFDLHDVMSMSEKDVKMKDLRV